MTFSEWYAANVEPGVIQTVNAIPDKATRELTLKAARDSMVACWNAALDAAVVTEMLEEFRRVTYTYAVLMISKPAFDEIKAKLEAAGYQGQFVKTADGIEIDMRGIGIAIDKESGNKRVARSRG